MSKAEDTPKTAAETLESVLAFVKRSFMFWKRSTFVFLVVALAAIPGVFMKARIYKSETVVLYQETIKAEAITGGESGENARRVGARLRETLLSRGSLEPIVNDVPRYATLADKRGMVDAVDELRGHIGFKAREGDAFEISYEAPIPAEAQEVTRRLGQSIVEQAASQRNEQTKATQQYLEAQSKANKAKLDDANGALSNFLTLHPEYQRFLLPGAQGQAVGGVPAGTAFAATPPPGTKDPVLFQMQAELASVQAQLKAGKGELAPAPAAPPHEESDELKAARRDLAEKRAQGLTDTHPDMAGAKRRLQAALEADQKRAPAPAPAQVRTGKMSEAERDALEARATQLRRNIANHRPATAPAPAPPPVAGSASAGAAASASGKPAASAPAASSSVEFDRLRREVENLKDAQKVLDDKLFRANLTLGASSSDRNIQVKILDPAYLPVHPISKPRSTMLAMYLLAAWIAAALLAFVSARLDDRIYQRRDLEILDILPVVGVVPRAGTRRRRG